MRTKRDIKIKWNIIPMEEIKKINKVKKTSKAKERAIKRMRIKINININWRTQLILDWLIWKSTQLERIEKEEEKRLTGA